MDSVEVEGSWYNKKNNYPFSDFGLEPVFKPDIALTDGKTKFTRERKL